MDPGGDVSPGPSAREYRYLGTTQNDILFRRICNREQPESARFAVLLFSAINPRLTPIHVSRVHRPRAERLSDRRDRR